MNKLESSADFEVDVLVLASCRSVLDFLIQATEPCAAPQGELEKLDCLNTCCEAVTSSQTPHFSRSAPSSPPGYHSSKGKGSSLDLKVSYVSHFSGCKGLERYSQPKILTLDFRRINDLSCCIWTTFSDLLVMKGLVGSSFYDYHTFKEQYIFKCA